MKDLQKVRGAKFVSFSYNDGLLVVNAAAPIDLVGKKIRRAAKIASLVPSAQPFS
jgi:hypothetical protein